MGTRVHSPMALSGAGGVLSSPASVAEVRLLEQNSRAKTRQLAEVYRATAEALASAIAAKDTYEQHHVRRVQFICELIAHKMGLGGHEIDGISIAAMLHDVGKLGVPNTSSSSRDPSTRRSSPGSPTMPTLGRRDT